MKKVTAYETMDGVTHSSYQTAKRHADDRLGDFITQLAHRLVACDGKYVKFIGFIEDHIDTLAQLAELKADTLVEAPDDED